ncbi:MAG: sulfite exporter TauE/SafE family protein [Cognatishimia sp.]|uniref:sulfite exporter TauE/SafE family protein n=1 Tax=Cognatishimia sp. TaxID=2211648 RepID=UPI003B8AD31E
MDITLILGLLAGAALGGFINGFAGFGTALFASGIWFAVLPFELVPPLIVISAMAGQLIGLARLSAHVSFHKAWPLISGGLLGVPVGTLALFVIPPTVIKSFVAVFLIAYAMWKIFGSSRQVQLPPKPLYRERLVGVAGGILGGLAGLAGPLPLIWCQLQNLTPQDQRARYQPFNLLILSAALVSMLSFGMITIDVIKLAVLSFPATLLSTLLGLWVFKRTSDAAFKALILWLLLASGVAILLQMAI